MTSNDEFTPAFFTDRERRRLAHIFAALQFSSADWGRVALPYPPTDAQEREGFLSIYVMQEMLRCMEHIHAAEADAIHAEDWAREMNEGA